MDEQIKEIIQHYTLNGFQVAIISIVVSVLTFLITNWIKNFFENKLLQRKLETEHKFDQRKKIKEALVKYKVHLLTACEDMNHRLWNLNSNYERGWMNVGGNYISVQYYFHSSIYKMLSLFSWIGRVKKEMIFLDTTIASKEDLEFIKFLKVFPNVLCDLAFIVGKNADGEYAYDHFFRMKFELLPDIITSEHGVKSYSEYERIVESSGEVLLDLYSYFDGISPLEERIRWDRIHLLHLTLIVFLNNYGYDYQQTSESKMEEIINGPRVSKYLSNYFELLKEYRLDQNKEVVRLEKIARKYYVLPTILN